MNGCPHVHRCTECGALYTCDLPECERLGIYGACLRCGGTLRPAAKGARMRADLARENVKVSVAKNRIEALEAEKAAAKYEVSRMSLRVDALQYALNLAWLHAKAQQDELAGLRARQAFEKRDRVALAGRGDPR